MRCGLRTHRLAGLRRNAGFSLLEVTLASSIFMIIGYVFASAITMGTSSQRLVMQSAEDSESLREATSALRSELKITNDDMVGVTALAGGNHQLAFQVPIELGGAVLWGAEHEDIGPDPIEGWQVCYTVNEEVVGGETERTLVRQILDDEGNVQVEEAVVSGLGSGAEDPAGFQVQKSGDMWVVTLSLEGQMEGVRGRSSEFHVKTRN